MSLRTKINGFTAWVNLRLTPYNQLLNNVLMDLLSGTHMKFFVESFTGRDLKRLENMDGYVIWIYACFCQHSFCLFFLFFLKKKNMHLKFHSVFLKEVHHIFLKSVVLGKNHVSKKCSLVFRQKFIGYSQRNNHLRVFFHEP